MEKDEIKLEKTTSKKKKAIVTTALCAGLVLGCGGIMAGCAQTPLAPPTWHSGNDSPTQGIGVVGDMYVDTNAYILYQKKANGWAVVMENYGKPGDEGQSIPGAPGKDGNVFFTGTTLPAANANLGDAKIGDFYLDTAGRNLYVRVADEGEATDWEVSIANFGAQGEPGAAGTVIEQITGQYVWDADGKLCLELTIDYAGEKPNDVITAPLPTPVKSLEVTNRYMREGDMSTLKMNVTLDDKAGTVIENVAITEDMIMNVEGQTAFNKDEVLNPYLVDIWYQGKKFDNNGRHFDIQVYDSRSIPYVGWQTTAGTDAVLLPFSAGEIDTDSEEYKVIMDNIVLQKILCNDHGIKNDDTLSEFLADGGSHKIIYPEEMQAGTKYTATVYFSQNESATFDFIPVADTTALPEGYAVDSIEILDKDEIFVKKNDTPELGVVQIKSILTKAESPDIIRITSMTAGYTIDRQSVNTTVDYVNNSDNRIPQTMDFTAYGKTLTDAISVYVYDAAEIQMSARLLDKEGGVTVSRIEKFGSTSDEPAIRVSATLWPGKVAVLSEGYYSVTGPSLAADPEGETRLDADFFTLGNYGTETFYVEQHGYWLPIEVDIYDKTMPKSIDVNNTLKTENMTFVMSKTAVDVEEVIFARIAEKCGFVTEDAIMRLSWYPGVSGASQYTLQKGTQTSGHWLDLSSIDLTEAGEYSATLHYDYNGSTPISIQFTIYVTPPTIADPTNVITYNVAEENQQAMGIKKVEAYGVEGIAKVTLINDKIQWGYFDEASSSNTIIYTVPGMDGEVKFYYLINNTSHTIECWNPVVDLTSPGTTDAKATYTGQVLNPNTMQLEAGKIEVYKDADVYYAKNYIGEGATAKAVATVDATLQGNVLVTKVGGYTLNTAFANGVEGTLTPYQG